MKKLFVITAISLFCTQITNVAAKNNKHKKTTEARISVLETQLSDLQTKTTYLEELLTTKTNELEEKINILEQKNSSNKKHKKRTNRP